MFTGLIAAIGTVVSVAGDGHETELCVDVGDVVEGLSIGDSIALSGVCCTVTSIDGSGCAFILTEETLRRTWLGGVRPGDLLNLETPLRAGDPYGGHVVQGHVDGVGEVTTAIDPRDGGELWVSLPGDLMRYCVVKGSVALDGISLTIAAIEGDRVMLAIIPHTAQVTTLGSLAAGTMMHVEVDVMAKYVERLLEARFGNAPPPGSA